MLKDWRDGSSSGALPQAQHISGTGSRGNAAGTEVQSLEPVAVCPDAGCCVPSLTPCRAIPCVSLQCIVIGLQSTGEARTREVLDENDGHLNCFVSAAE